MISELIEFAKAQPILVGGVGTVLTSSALYLIRSVPDRIFSFMSSSLVSNLAIDNNHEYYNAVNLMVVKYRLPWTFRNFEPAESTEDDYGDSREDGDYLIPGYGSGWGIWNGLLFSFSKTREDQGNRPVKKLFIKFYTRKEKKLFKFFEAAMRFESRDSQRLFISNGTYWNRAADKKLRPLDTIFLDPNTKDKIVGGISSFLESEDKYLQRGIPYKYCMMFYGVPGTGKTSLIHALASHFRKDIYYVTRLGNLSQLFASKKIVTGIIVIEDIDSLSENLNRKKQEEDDDLPPILGGIPPISKKESEVTSAFHDLLNTVDGFTSQHGLIIAITTNHPERLDPALIRPGRIDLAVEIGPLDVNTAKDMYFAFYSKEDEWTVPCWDMIEMIYSPIVGSELQQIFLENDPNGAFRAIVARVSTKKDAQKQPVQA